MPEENKQTFFENLKKRFLANRIAVESVLFENENKYKPSEKIDYRYWLYFFLIIFTYISLNFIYFSRNGDILSFNDLKSLEYVKTYITSSISSIISYSDITSINFDMPLYYLLYIPVIKLFGPSYSIFFVNSILVLILSISIYLILIETRNKNTAITGVLTMLSMPFIFEITRNFSPVLMTMTVVSWSYYLYIKTNNFEKTSYIPALIIIFSLGFITDKFYILYVLPILGFINFLITSVYAYLLIWITVPCIVISLIFYLRFLTLLIFKYIIGGMHFSGFWNLGFYLKSIINSTGMIYFIILLLFFIWLCFARYMIYNNKKTLIKWLLYPLIIFSFIPFINEQNIYPAIIPLVAGGVIMIPLIVRKYYIYLTTLIIITEGIFTFNPLTIDGYKLFGVKNTYAEKKSINAIMLSLKEESDIDNTISNATDKNDNRIKLAGVYTENQYINFYTFNSVKRNYKLDNLIFIDLNPKISSFLDYIIVNKNNINLIDKSIFYEVSNIKELYLMKKKSINFNAEENILSEYIVPHIKIGELTLDNNIVSINNYDKERGAADYAIIKSNYANFKGIDIYGLKLKINDFQFSRNSPYFITGFSSAEILDSKISDFSLTRFVEDKFNDKLSIEFIDDLIKLNSQIMGAELTVYGNIDIKDSDIKFKVNYFKYGIITMPKFICNFLNFKLNSNQYSIPLKINRIKINQGIIILQ